MFSLNEVQIFDNQQFGKIRTVTIEGKTYFVASDVAKALGYAIPHKAVQTHCKGVLKWNIPTKSGNQDVLAITEGDLYRLVVKSKLPSAEQFECWIFDEVLPTIRQTGSYGRTRLPQNPMELLELHYQALKQTAEEVEMLKQEIAQLKEPQFITESEMGMIRRVVKAKVEQLLGGVNSRAYANKSLHRKLYQSIYSVANGIIGVATYRSLKQEQVADYIMFVSVYYQPLTSVKAEIEKLNRNY